MINIAVKSDCTGCSACVNVCPNNCIKMVPDKEGFLYPIVNINECLHCNLCNSICPTKKHKKESFFEVKVYGAYSKNQQKISMSSSGGIFSELAEQFFSLHPNGVLYGATCTDNLKIKHIKIESADEIKSLRGSKYVQSELDLVYSEIRSYLNNARPVYFSGTPCQVAGLKSFLCKEYSNLFTQAILCHGVPSPKVWNLFLKSVQSKYDKKIISVSFRDKTYGWENYSLSITFKDGSSVVENSSKNIFLRAFGSNIDLRPSCYKCKFKYPQWDADIIIGDFWNASTVCPKIYNKLGTSLIFVSSHNGELLFDKTSNNLTVEKITFDEAFKSQHGIVTNTPMNKKRNIFFDNITFENFDSLITDLTKTPIHKKIRAIAAKKYRSLKHKILLHKKGNVD